MSNIKQGTVVINNLELETDFAGVLRVVNINVSAETKDNEAVVVTSLPDEALGLIAETIADLVAEQVRFNYGE